MITIKHKKIGITTSVQEVHLEDYLKNDWERVDAVKEELNEYENIAAKTIAENPAMAAHSRERGMAKTEDEARAIIATELKKERNKEFTDGLIKGE